MFLFCPFCGFKASEQTDAYDGGKDGFQCKGCGKNIYYNSAPTSSVVLVVGDEMLLSVRGIEPFKGTLDIVGGFLKNGEDPLEGAVREFKEETSFELKKEQLKLLSIEMDTYPYQGNVIYTFNLIYMAKLDQKPQVRPSDDVSGLNWVKIEGEYDFAFKYLPNVQAMLKKHN